MTFTPPRILTPEPSHPSVTIEDVNIFGEPSTRLDERPISNHWALYPSSLPSGENLSEQLFDELIYNHSAPLGLSFTSQPFQTRTEVEREDGCPNNVRAAFRNNTPPFTLFQSDEVQQNKVNEEETISMHEISLVYDEPICSHTGTTPRAQTPDVEAAYQR